MNSRILWNMVENAAQDRGVSIQEVSEVAGISRSTLYNLRDGKNVDLSTIESLCAYFGWDYPATLASITGALDNPTTRRSSARDQDDVIEMDVRRIIHAELKALLQDPRIVLYAFQVPGVSSWALGRMTSLFLRLRMAQRYIRRGADEASQRCAARPNELVGMMLLDVADLAISLGRLRDAASFGGSARQETEALLANLEQGDPDEPRYRMGHARALLVEQSLAHLQGNHEKFRNLHDLARPELTLAGDNYGWAKTLYLNAYLRFHQGDYVDAERVAAEANLYGKKIQPRFSPLWDLRDGVRFGAAWWHLQPVSLLLDCLACKGEFRSDRFRETWHEYHEARQDARWAPDIPSLAPRYLWVTEWDRPPASKIENQFEEWINNSRKWGFLLYLPDIYMSFGDFLNAGGRGSSAAEMYQRAEDAALSCGYDFVAQVAGRRRAGLGIPPLVERLRDA
jgi:DNA-binding Xre family transcriptional regulator